MNNGSEIDFFMMSHRCSVLTDVHVVLVSLFHAAVLTVSRLSHRADRAVTIGLASKAISLGLRSLEKRSTTLEGNHVTSVLHKVGANHTIAHGRPAVVVDVLLVGVSLIENVVGVVVFFLGYQILLLHHVPICSSVDWLLVACVA